MLAPRYWKIGVPIDHGGGRNHEPLLISPNSGAEHYKSGLSLTIRQHVCLGSPYRGGRACDVIFSGSLLRVCVCVFRVYLINAEVELSFPSASMSKG